MQMNPSVNNFMHHKTKIIGELKKISDTSTQWDKIDLVDYTLSPVIRQCPIVIISNHNRSVQRTANRCH